MSCKGWAGSFKGYRPSHNANASWSQESLAVGMLKKTVSPIIERARCLYHRLKRSTLATEVWMGVITLVSSPQSTVILSELASFFTLRCYLQGNTHLQNQGATWHSCFLLWQAQGQGKLPPGEHEQTAHVWWSLGHCFIQMLPTLVAPG